MHGVRGASMLWAGIRAYRGGGHLTIMLFEFLILLKKIDTGRKLSKVGSRFQEVWLRVGFRGDFSCVKMGIGLLLGTCLVESSRCWNRRRT